MCRLMSEALATDNIGPVLFCTLLSASRICSCHDAVRTHKTKQYRSNANIDLGVEELGLRNPLCGDHLTLEGLYRRFHKLEDK